MPVLELKDANLYYEVRGEGPPVVFAHGMGGNHAIWYRQVATFSRSYTVVSFDHRGFGLSTDPQGRGRSAFVDDLEALLDHLQLARVALVGQSMGAGTCVGFACRNPQRVSALVIADSLHGLQEPASVKPLMDAARAASADLPQAERVLSAQFRAAHPERSLLYSQISSFNERGRGNMAGEWQALHSPAQLAATGIPVLFLAATHDILFPLEAVQRMQEQVEGSFLVEISDSGHSAFWERPVEFNDSVLSALQMAGWKGLRPAHSNAPGYVRTL
jgi:3-oxoadipate enol-lactonase